MRGGEKLRQAGARSLSHRNIFPLKNATLSAVTDQVVIRSDQI
jgi:hypothetical protein